MHTCAYAPSDIAFREHQHCDCNHRQPPPYTIPASRAEIRLARIPGVPSPCRHRHGNNKSIGHARLRDRAHCLLYDKRTSTKPGARRPVHRSPKKATTSGCCSTTPNPRAAKNFSNAAVTLRQRPSHPLLDQGRQPRPRRLRRRRQPRRQRRAKRREQAEPRGGGGGGGECSGRSGRC